ncbi:Uncharacterized protein K02A2.6 [Eumeta japonica]|uniref:Uncharacterized protein K02A2.6 n=1 Tax=Eumeta variegata TaxID=151549 RepID=A0A4C1Y9Z0_EUMVA|nr:Uncharacterized protein K02A2.6 [Eumeta japonica]
MRQATFQIIMDKILVAIRYRNAIVYVGDILVCGEILEELCDALRDKLDRFRKTGLVVKSSKCTFAYEWVTILGYEVSKKQIKPSKTKLSAELELKMPSSANSLKLSGSHVLL